VPYVEKRGGRRRNAVRTRLLRTPCIALLRIHDLLLYVGGAVVAAERRLWTTVLAAIATLLFVLGGTHSVRGLMSGGAVADKSGGGRVCRSYTRQPSTVGQADGRTRCSERTYGTCYGRFVTTAPSMRYCILPRCVAWQP